MQATTTNEPTTRRTPQKREVFLRVPIELIARIEAEMRAKDHEKPQALILAVLNRAFPPVEQVETEEKEAA